MRVLAIVNNFPWPAAPYDGMFNLRALLALRDRGHEVSVLRAVPWAPPMRARWQRYRSVPTHYDVEGVSVRALRGLMGPKSFGIGSLALQLRGAVKEEIEKIAPDIIHVHGLLPAGTLGLASERPFVVTAHGSETYALPLLRDGLARVARDVLRRAVAVAAVSEFTAGYVRMLGRSDVRVIHNGADATLFFPGDRRFARDQLKLPQDRPIVLFVGHLEHEKGATDLALALQRLGGLKPLALFAGTGSRAGEITGLLSSHAIEARLLGATPHDQLAQLYRAADVVALPSYKEGLPTVICEAMCSGRIVIASPVGGIPEIVRDGETGYLVPPGDLSGLARRLRDGLQSVSARERMEEQAALFGCAHLTWSENARRYEELYEGAATETLRMR